MINYKRFAIVDVGFSIPAPTFGPQQGYVWKTGLYLSLVDQQASFWTVNFNATYENVNTELIQVNSVLWQDRTLARLTAYEQLFAPTPTGQDFPAFYFDYDEQIIYCRFWGDNPGYLFRGVVYGNILGFASRHDQYLDEPPNSSFGGVYYDPRLIETSVNDRITLDNFDRSKMSFDSFSVTLINPDGQLDSIRSGVMNQLCLLRFAAIPADQELRSGDFRTIRYGYVRDVSFPDDGRAVLSVEDPRGTWTDKVVNVYYTAVEYPYIATDNKRLIDKSKPLCIGPLNNVPCDRTDTEEFTFSAIEYGAMNQTGKPAVYVDGELEPAGNITYTNGEGHFTISGYTTGVVTCDVDGLLIPTASTGIDGTCLDIVLWLITTFTSLKFDDNDFNTSEIQTIINNRQYPGGLYIKTGGERLKNLIDQAVFSVNCVIYPQTFGAVLSFAELTINSEPYRVYPDELTTPPRIRYNNRSYLSRILVLFSKDQKENEFESVLRDQDEEATIEVYRSKKQFDFETILTNEADAIELADERYGFYSVIPSVLTLRFTFPIPNEIDLTTLIAFDYNMNRRQRLDDGVYRVTQISRVQQEITVSRYSDVDLNSGIFEILEDYVGI